MFLWNNAWFVSVWFSKKLIYLYYNLHIKSHEIYKVLPFDFKFARKSNKITMRKMIFCLHIKVGMYFYNYKSFCVWPNTVIRDILIKYANGNSEKYRCYFFNRINTQRPFKNCNCYNYPITFKFLLRFCWPCVCTNYWLTFFRILFRQNVQFSSSKKLIRREKREIIALLRAFSLSENCIQNSPNLMPAASYLLIFI